MTLVLGGCAVVSQSVQSITWPGRQAAQSASQPVSNRMCCHRPPPTAAAFLLHLPVRSAACHAIRTAKPRAIMTPMYSYLVLVSTCASASASDSASAASHRTCRNRPIFFPLPQSAIHNPQSAIRIIARQDMCSSQRLSDDNSVECVHVYSHKLQPVHLTVYVSSLFPLTELYLVFLPYRVHISATVPLTYRHFAAVPHVPTHLYTTM